MKLTVPRRRRFRSGLDARFVDRDIWQRLKVATVILTGVLGIGTLGYMALGLSLLDAVYQTVVTVSTVGYREIGEVTTNYKLFSITLILFGAGSVLYTIGVLLETLVEGRLTQEFGRRRMHRNIDSLTGHIVVCGWGQVGRAITATLMSEGNDVVVVDRDSSIEQQHELFVLGDATDDDTLAAAGISRASALVVALNTGPANVYVTLSGRAADPDIFIVTRAMSAGDEQKLFRAGANRVVNPHELGGAHMAALVTQPNVAEFLDIAMHDRELNVSIAEVAVPKGSTLDTRPLSNCESCGVTVLAVRKAGGGFVHHPKKDAVLSEGDVVIALGTEAEHDILRRMAISTAQ